MEEGDFYEVDHRQGKRPEQIEFSERVVVYTLLIGALALVGAAFYKIITHLV